MRFVSDPNLEEVVGRVIDRFPDDVRSGVGCRTLYHKDLWILKVLRPVLQSRQADILDVGAGSGVVTQALAELGHSVSAIDTWSEYSADCVNHMGCDSEIVARLEKHGVKCIRANILTDPWPVPDKSFDVVIFSEVIEHIQHSPKAILKRLWMTLKPGGTLLMTTPNHARLVKRLAMLTGESAYSSLQSWWDEMPFYGHIREYTPKEVEYMLRNTGFTDIRIHVSNSPMLGRLREGGRIWQALVLAYMGISGVWPNWRVRMLVTGQRPA